MNALKPNGQVKSQPMGDAALRRNYFEKNTAFFGDSASLLVKAYGEACLKAEWSARIAIKRGTIETLRTAQWHEAIAQTIERLLGCLPNSTDESFEIDPSVEFDFPDSPCFEPM